MASNAPYYQSVQPPPQTQPQSHEQSSSDEFKIQLMDYGGLAPQASMYPDPNQAQMTNDYQTQQLTDNEPEDHAQLQGLVEAATSAAARDIRHHGQVGANGNGSGSGIGPVPAYPHAEQQADAGDQALASLLRGGGGGSNNNANTNDIPAASAVNNSNSNPGKRKRSLSAAGDTADQSPTEGQSEAADQPKRKKRPAPGQHLDQSMVPYQQPVESPHHLDARAAGVHSAAALFRPPSDSSKKYTRPPMSKLFTSLQLSPENFLYLQAAAKQFMLDPDHPERQACVGNRGRGDSDMVKLRLHHCVRDFLEADGLGQKYFGEDAPPPGEGENGTPGEQRQFIWPRDKDRIIALCTPLLRRMVTNERQRQYAIETRKGGKPEKPTSGNEEGASAGPEDNMQQGPYDPRLNHGPGCQIYMLDGVTRNMIGNRIDFPTHEGLSWDYLLQTIHRVWSEIFRPDVEPAEIANEDLERFGVKVVASGGLTSVSNEGEWQLAIEDVQQTVYLEGLVKVVVECARTTPQEQ